MRCEQKKSKHFRELGIFLEEPMASAAASSLTASQTLILRCPNSVFPRNSPTLSLPSPSKHHLLLSPSRPTTLSLVLPPGKPLTVSLTSRKSRVFASSSSSSSSTPVLDKPPASSPDTAQSLLSGSTRTIVTIFAFTVASVRLAAWKICDVASKLKTTFTNPSPEELATIETLRGSLVYTVGPLFFAALKDRGHLNTPLTVVASGMAKWLDIYGGVLMVRVLLSWFPNIPWDRQPLSAIRDLCDPYLNLFRNIIPPIFDTLDVSPLLAFAVLGSLGSILNSSR
ncbi:ylmG homolog protein 1-2, chloroplastic-like [Diospyros lotus]|uniref:ylmG homolog protein 1-2, chloroplastic-like n=1 Tax=Diospyros lotus TaxID=55363 RepID=UPI00224F77DA|nr:ylmG homolog protein 1-2, chloroplastic-like [Diospyros lotus]